MFEEGPWFWETRRLFIILLFSDFDPHPMLFSKMSVWVCPLNLPLHFLYLSVFEDIENTSGTYIKSNLEIVVACLCTHACVCVD